MQGKLPEGNIFCYFPYNMKNKITLTYKRAAQLTKGKAVQSYAMACHNPTPVWGIVDCGQIMTVPNGTTVTLNQAIMGVKTQQDFKSPLYLGVDTQPDGSVIVTCNKSFKEES